MLGWWLHLMALGGKSHISKGDFILFFYYQLMYDILIYGLK